MNVPSCGMHAARCFTHALIHAVWQLACAAKPTLSTQCRRRGRRPTAARTRCKSSARAAQSSAGSRSATTRDKHTNKRLLWHKPNTAAAHNRLRAAGRSVCNEQRCNARTSLQHNTHRATAGLRSGGSAAAYWRSSGAQCGLARCPLGIVLGSASASGAASGSARLIRRSAGSCWPSPGAGRMPWPSPPTSPPLHVVWTMLCSHSAC